MPQASDELRERMGKFYGDEIDDMKPLQFLLANGWKESGGYLTPPKCLQEVSEQEFLSALFLRDEWDYDFSKESKESIQ